MLDTSVQSIILKFIRQSFNTSENQSLFTLITTYNCESWCTLKGSVLFFKATLIALSHKFVDLSII